MTTDTLHITVESAADFFEEALADIRRLETGEKTNDKRALSLPDEEALARIHSPRNVELLRTIAAENPDSMRETARLVDRDIKDVSRNLRELAELGLIEFERDGRSKRPVVEFDRIEIDVPIAGDLQTGRNTDVASS